MKTWMAMLCAVVLAACGPGEQGPEGPAGPPGPGISSVTTVVCSDFVDMTGTGSGMEATHLAYIFPDGGVMTTCIGEGSEDQSSSFLVWRRTDNGAASALCLFTFDLDGAANGGFWEFRLATDRRSSRITYHDLGSPYDGRQYSISCRQV